MSNLRQQNERVLMLPPKPILTSEPPTALQVLKKYGVSRNYMMGALVNSYHLQPELKRNGALSYYRQLRQSKTWFTSRCNEGTIKHEGVTYIVVYHLTTRHAVLTSKGVDIKLSFRSPAKEFNLPSYVLVTLASNTSPEVSNDAS
jgi:hypothetical protein